MPALVRVQSAVTLPDPLTGIVPVEVTAQSVTTVAVPVLGGSMTVPDPLRVQPAVKLPVPVT